MTSKDWPSGWVCRKNKGTVILRVRLTPNGGRNEFGTVVTRDNDCQMLSAKVTAIPEKGRANKALEKLLAKSIGVAPAYVEVVAGHKDRVKTVKISGDADQIVQSLESLPK